MNDIELKKIKEDELRNVINNHNLWIITKEQEGQKGDLSRLDMNGLHLYDLTFRDIDISESDLRYTQFRNCKFYSVILSRANFSYSNLYKSQFNSCLLNGTNFTSANLSETIFSLSQIGSSDFTNSDLDGANLDVTYGKPLLTLDQEQSLSQIISFNKKEKKNIEDEASFEIVELKKELDEREQQLAAAQESEKEKIKIATRFIENKLEETKIVLEKERKAKESTRESIEIGIGHLKAPNSYLQAQINVQYGLTILYGVLAILTVAFLCYYIGSHYAEFKTDLTKETTFLQWLFYALPIAVCFSLIITFINQINSRLKNVIALHEKKRYVDSISGGLKAVQELSENNKEARSRISGVLDEILNNTITLSEKLQEDVLPDEKPIDNKVSVSLKDLKDLFSK